MFSEVKKKYIHYFSFKEKNKVTPLSKVSILLLIILDIFVFYSIDLGIDFQTQVINNPGNKYTYQCRKLVKNPKKIQKYSFYSFDKNNSKHISNYNNTIQEIKSEELDTRCKKIDNYISTINDDKQIFDIVSSIKQREKDLDKIETKLNYIRNNYNTVLFEKMAKQKDSILNMDLNTINTKEKYEKLKKEKELLDSILEENLNKFKENTAVNDFYKYLLENKSIIDDYENSLKFYKIKKSAIAMLFLLPLLLLFIYRMKINNTKNNYNKYIIDKNLFFITLIPFTIQTINTIWNIIPHAFFNKLLKSLYELNIPFLAFYILIGLFIFILSFMIIKIQNKVNLNKKDKKNPLFIIKSFNQNKCIYCSNKIDYIHMNYCSFCGNDIKETCSFCSKMTIKGLDYCMNCGNTKKKKDNI